MYSIGEFYGVKGLKSLAKQRFKDQAHVSWIDSTFGPAVKAVYDSTVESDRGLRNVAVDVTVRNFTELIKDQKFKDVMGEMGAFSRDVAVALYEDREKQEDKKKCECMYTQGKTPSSTCSKNLGF